MLKKKYIRIQDRWIGKTGKPVGIFAVCWYHINQKIFNEDEIKLFHEIDKWFIENLVKPEFYKDPENKYNTWFKTDKTEHMIEKLKPLMDLLDKYKRPYDIIYTDYPGEIIYEDDYQVGVK